MLTVMKRGLTHTVLCAVLMMPIYRVSSMMPYGSHRRIHDETADTRRSNQIVPRQQHFCLSCCLARRSRLGNSIFNHLDS